MSRPENTPTRPDQNRPGADSTMRDRSREAGAALVELALVASLLVVLVMGIFEMGSGWNDAQLVTQAARTGSRVATQLGTDPSADQRVLESVQAALGDLEPHLTRVVVFRSLATDGSLPASCLTANHPGEIGECSVYHHVHFNQFADGAWPPSTRGDSLTGADYLGVLVEVDRPMVTEFFGVGPMPISDTAIMRIEPGS